MYFSIDIISIFDMSISIFVMSVSILVMTISLFVIPGSFFVMTYQTAFWYGQPNFCYCLINFYDSALIFVIERLLRIRNMLRNSVLIIIF